MTKQGKRCAWCGGALPERVGSGRPRRYCKQGCRQQAHIARKLARAQGLAPDEVLVSRYDLEELQGLLYGLQSAIEDVDSDLKDSDGATDAYREAFDWLRSATEPLASFWLEPKAVHAASKLAPPADSTA